MSKLDVHKVCLIAGEFKVKNICFQVNDADYHVLMGPTGSGKSLLLSSICGLIKVNSGEISLGGNDITWLEPRFRNIGYVPQHSALFPNINVLKNIEFPLKVRGISIDSQLKDKLIKSLQIEYLLNRSTVNLSGGERQKVALARALVSDPDLLILDEPVSALDEPTRRETCNLLKRVQQEFKTTTIHVCHSVDEAKIVANSIGVMAEGELIRSGKSEDIFADADSHPVLDKLLNFKMV